MATFYKSDSIPEAVADLLTVPRPVGTMVLNNAILYRSASASVASYSVISPSSDFIFVEQKSDFPTAVGGVITLVAEVTYFLLGDVDLEGDRIVCAQDNVILGASSENSILRSTGLVGTALITSAFSLPLRYFTITANVGVALDTGDPASVFALDWVGLNFLDCPTIGTIANYGNFIYLNGAILNSAGLTFDGTFGTIGVDGSLFNGRAGATVITLPATLTVTRRFRIIYSSFVVLAGETGIAVPDPTIFDNEESYILDTVNFAGGSGTFITGTTSTSNKANFTECVGIVNSATAGQYFMVGNATATNLTVLNTYVKVAGTTTAGTLFKFTHSNNRLTYVGAFEKCFNVSAILSFSGPNNHSISVRVAVNGTTAAASESRSTTDIAGRVENMSCQHITNLAPNDFIEIWIADGTSVASAVTATELNVIIEASL